LWVGVAPKTGFRTFWLRVPFVVRGKRWYRCVALAERRTKRISLRRGGCACAAVGAVGALVPLEIWRSNFLVVDSLDRPWERALWIVVLAELSTLQLMEWLECHFVRMKVFRPLVQRTDAAVNTAAKI
jgi:hypothetical protein